MADFTLNIPTLFGLEGVCAEELRRQGDMPRVRGLLYLSDGFGSFPDRPPDYPVTFLLLEDEGFWKPDLPPWAGALFLNRNNFTLKEAPT